MPSLVNDLRELIPLEKALSFAVALLIVLMGWMLARLARGTAQKLAARRMSAQGAVIAGRVAFYAIFLLAFAEALHHAGLDLSVAMGAAGLLTVAIGFASQTATSNLISGLFLMAEKPFEIGDTIQVGATIGEVLSIDALSVKLRTADNLLVRLPNENLLKSEIINLSAFPIRRFELAIDVAYASDLEHVQEVLERAADAEPLCLDEPRPTVQVASFGESAVQLKLAVWTDSASQVDLKTRLLIAVHRIFEEENIDIPYPHRTVVWAPGSPRPGTEPGPPPTAPPADPAPVAPESALPVAATSSGSGGGS